MEFAATLGLIVGFGAVVTKTVDLIRNLFDRNDTAPSFVWSIVALVVGVGYCLGWQLDASASIFALVPAFAENSDRLTGIAGQVLTGLLAGGAAGFMHELFGALSARAHHPPRPTPRV